MPNLSVTNQAPAGIEPLSLPIPQVTALTGLSRSAIYRAAGEGKIDLLKVGRTALVDMATVRTFLAGLPRASIRPPRPAAAVAMEGK
jgi:hypothetical protein